MLFQSGYQRSILLKMSKNVLLVISNLSKTSSSLIEAKNYFPKYLYIQVLNQFKTTKIGTFYSKIVSEIYAESIQCCENINVRVLLSSLKTNSFNKIQKPIDVVIFDEQPDQREKSLIMEKLHSCMNVIVMDSNQNREKLDTESDNDVKMYDNVVLGGTFDRLHAGHKILLSEAVLRTKKRLVIGVTDVNMIQNKKLPELILPISQRISQLREFLIDVDNTIQYEIVPIQDPFGPTQSDPNLDLIVVSSETMRGGEKVNEIRLTNNLKPLKIHCIPLVESKVNIKEKEFKVSSSNRRMDMLGLRIREPESKPHLPTKPYVIGLIGGIAAGKSVMAERFRKLGAKVVDCDKIAHKVYEPGQKCYHEIIENFGLKVVDFNGNIDRKELGKIVFNDKEKLELLNKIVWPHVLEDVKKIIKSTKDYEIIVLEAAVLLKAGWEKECHEIWACVISKQEAVKRLKERNKLTEEEALQRISHLDDNETIVKNANVVFSPEWSYEFSEKQANSAWQVLMQSIRNKTKL